MSCCRGSARSTSGWKHARKRLTIPAERVGEILDWVVEELRAAAAAVFAAPRR